MTPTTEGVGPRSVRDRTPTARPHAIPAAGSPGGPRHPASRVRGFAPERLADRCAASAELVTDALASDVPLAELRRGLGEQLAGRTSR